MPSAQEWLDRAVGAYEDGELDAALDSAQRALAADPHALEAMDLQAVVLCELGEFEQADEVFDALMEREPTNPAWVLAAADAKIRYPGDDRERIEEGLELLEPIRRKVTADAEVEAAWHLLVGIAQNQLGDCAAALKALDRVLTLEPEHLEGMLERGVALFELARFDEASKAMQKLLTLDPSEPWAHHYLGLIAERRGADAEVHFARARDMAPEEFPEPASLSSTEFDAAVAEAVAGLPAHAKPHLANAIIDVQPLPSDDDLKEGVSPSILGIFRGVPIDERLDSEPAHHVTTHISLFQKNLERFATTRDELIEEIGVTVLHEVGHLLGLDEDELYERGLD